MPYQLGWYKNTQVILLKLDDKLQTPELHRANQDVLAVLDASDMKKSILIDVTHFVANYQSMDELRNTQTYANHPRLDSIFVVTDNKLNRLITLVAFSRARAKFFQFVNLEFADKMLQRFGLLPKEWV